MQPLNTRLDSRVQEQIEQIVADAISGINTGSKSGVVIRRLDLEPDGEVHVDGVARLSAIEVHLHPEHGMLSLLLHTTEMESYIEANHVTNTYADDEYVFYLDELGEAYARLGRALTKILSAYLSLPPATADGHGDSVFGDRIMPSVPVTRPDSCFSTTVTVDEDLQQVYRAPWSHQSREQELPIRRVPAEVSDMTLE